MTLVKLFSCGIYSGIKPAKGKVINKKTLNHPDGNWVKIYFAKDNFLYYTTSDNHILKNYENIYALCHIFYILKEFYNFFPQDSYEIFFICKIQNEIVEYLKSKKLKLDTNDSIVLQFASEFLNTEASILKNNILEVKNDYLILKDSVLQTLGAFKSDLEGLSSKMVNLSKTENANISDLEKQIKSLKSEVNKKIGENTVLKNQIGSFQSKIQDLQRQLSESRDAYDDVTKENQKLISKIKVLEDDIKSKNKIWERTNAEQSSKIEKLEVTISSPDKEKIALQKENQELQSIIDRMERSIETPDAEKNALFMENSDLKTEIRKLEKRLRKFEEKIVFTKKEYSVILKKHNEDKEAAHKAGYQTYLKNFDKFIEKTPLERNQITVLLNNAEFPKVMDSLKVWSSNWIHKLFEKELLERAELEKLGMYICIVNFAKFWRDIVLPNIGKLDQPIFKMLIAAWIDMIRAFKVTGAVLNDQKLNFLFYHYATSANTGSYKENFYIIPFFHILISSCRNVQLFLGMINVFTQKNGLMTEEVVDNMVKDFGLLYTVAEPIDILRRNMGLLDVLNMTEEETKVYLEYK